MGGFCPSDSDEIDESTEANLFSIIKTTECLEWAFVSSAILDNAAYEAACSKLLAQAKTVQRALRTGFPDVHVFMKRYEVDCPLASDRLFVVGAPATQLFPTGSQKGKELLLAFELSERFVTLLDALRLKERAIDGIQPMVQEIVCSINQLPRLSSDSEEVAKLVDWHTRLGAMKATDFLSEDSARQLMLDIELSYASIRSWLQYRQ